MASRAHTVGIFMCVGPGVPASRSHVRASFKTFLLRLLMSDRPALAALRMPVVRAWPSGCISVGPVPIARWGGQVAYDLVVEKVRQGHQVMVFVHSRGSHAHRDQCIVRALRGPGMRRRGSRLKMRPVLAQWHLRAHSHLRRCRFAWSTSCLRKLRSRDDAFLPFLTFLAFPSRPILCTIAGAVALLSSLPHRWPAASGGPISIQRPWTVLRGFAAWRRVSSGQLLLLQLCVAESASTRGRPVPTKVGVIGDEKGRPRTHRQHGISAHVEWGKGRSGYEPQEQTQALSRPQSQRERREWSKMVNHGRPGVHGIEGDHSSQSARHEPEPPGVT